MFGTRSFTYSSENLLLTGPASTTLSYDPAMRLYQTVTGSATVRMAYDGLDRIAEYNGANVLKRRYVHGSGIDQPLVWYEGTGTSDRRFLSSDERGSIISVTDSSGALLRINKYDEYGNPQGTNLGLWGYTGQAWLPGMGGWYYKARVYDRELGRFLQADPIGYAGGLNLYSYVGNDPVNWIDPLGLGAVFRWRKVCVAATCGWSGYWDWEPDTSAGSSGGGNGIGGGGGTDGNPGGGQRDDEPDEPKPEEPKCKGLVADIMKGLYEGGGKANQVAVNAGLAAGALAVIPGTQAAAPLMAGFAGISGSVGIASELVAGGYYAYHGNWGPLGKTAVGWGISKLNPFGKNTQPAWDKIVNLDDAKSTGNNQCNPD